MKYMANLPSVITLSFLKLVVIIVIKFIFLVTFYRSLTQNPSFVVGKMMMPNSLPYNLSDLMNLKIIVDEYDIEKASVDYGHLVNTTPAKALLYPSTTHDIASLIKFSYMSSKPFTIAARGHGHSVRGQAFAPNGVVINMESLGYGRNDRINLTCINDHDYNYYHHFINDNDNNNNCDSKVSCYADVGGEQLWIDVLNETMKFGLAPRSWTDYLYLTVGGTLSNAGISGQTFKYGPQISNVLEVDVITGTGEMLTCSHEENSELFYGVLGGLGQLGVITRARIILEKAPLGVYWVRLLYTDFMTFSKDQEYLISMDHNVGFNYLEGSLTREQTLISNWRSSDFFSESDAVKIGELANKSGLIYCLEGAMYYYGSSSSAHQDLESLLAKLNFVPGFSFERAVSYVKFLDRVHEGEIQLREMNLWDVPHPWINMFVPKSKIHDFDARVFKGIMRQNNFSSGPILVYPTKKEKWDERMSSVIPDEDVFYTVGLLRSATKNDLQKLDEQNDEILELCEREGYKIKQYLASYKTQTEWMKHFGEKKWKKLVQLKNKYDPKFILAPGQNIFTPRS